MEDIEIARNTELEKIDKLAENIGIKECCGFVSQMLMIEFVLLCVC